MKRVCHLCRTVYGNNVLVRPLNKDVLTFVEYF